MKKTFLIALAMVAVAILVGSVATLALFTAPGTAVNDNLTAGKIELQTDRDQGDTVPGPMFYPTAAAGVTDDGKLGKFPDGYWAPGDEHHKVLQIENVGELDVYLTKVWAVTESGSTILPNVLNVTVTADPEGTEVLATGKLSEFLAGAKCFVGGERELLSWEIANLHFWVDMDLHAGNIYQNESLKVAFNVYAEQMAHNPGPLTCTSDIPTP